MDGNKIVMNKYKKETILGSGTFGKVYLVKLNRARYALKEIKMNSLTSVEKQRAFNEVSLLAKLKHRNIIEYKESTLDHVTGNLLIVMEYADCGDLSNVIAKQKGYPFAERKILSWFIQIGLALQYIHSQNVLHRDLKTQNIFLCSYNVVKVGDFGIARILRESEDFANTGIGTPYYLSPEICMRRPYNRKSDVWALGCILFEVSALTLPFKAESFPQLMSLILEGKRRPLPSWSSDLIKQLVEDMLCFNPDNRPSIDEILAYPALQSYLSFHAKSPKGISPARMEYRSPPDSVKRSASSASTLSSKCSKLRKFSPRPTEDEQKPRSASTRSIPPVIIVTQYKTPDKFQESERKPRSASTQTTSPATVVTKDKFQKNEWKPLFASIRASPPAIVVTEHKTSDKIINSKPVLGNMSNMNVTYTAAKKSNCGKSLNSSEIPSPSTPSDIDCGYSSEEINCSADSADSSVCEHSINDRENEFTVLKVNEHEDKLSDQSHCPHLQCHQCMIDMMWKNRIRGCVGVSENNSDYLKLKKKLSLIFKHDLFQKIYESLLREWEGNETKQSQASIQSYVKFLNYEQVQNLPLMMQLIQLDLVKSSKDETYLKSQELVML